MDRRVGKLMSGLFVALSLYAAVLVVAFGAGLVIERAARAVFRKKAVKTQTDWDDWVAEEGFHLVPSLLLAVVATRILMTIRPPADAVEPLVTTGLQVVLVLAAIRVGVDLGLATLRIRQKRLGQQGVSILRNTLVGVALTAGVLVVLDQLGISVAPLLATLGVGALALALALQPTLGNIFAGIQLVAAGQFQVGDFLRVNDSGVEGYVTDIGWRTTTLRTLLDNYVIIPNSQLAESVLTNLHTPNPSACGSASEWASTTTATSRRRSASRATVIREVQDETEAGVPGFEGDIRWTAFGDSAITFDAILQAKKPLDRFAVASAFIKRLHRRYDEAGIEIPYPIRNLYLRTGLEVTGPESGTTGPGDG